MAGSRLFQFRYSYERDLVDIFAKVTYGSSGAPTLSQAKGVVSITRDSAGKYTLVLKDNFYLFMNMQNTQVVSSGVPAAPIFHVVSETVNATTKNIVIQFLSDASVATDPASGEISLFHITCRNAST